MNESINLSQASLLSVPSGYAALRLGIQPYKWQADCMDVFFREYAKAALKTCNESGKTSVVVAALVLWHMENFPWSMTITTSASNNQIKNQLYPVLEAKTSRWVGWECRNPVGGASRVTAPNGARCLSYSTDDKRLFEGFHRPNLENYLEGWDPPAEFSLSAEDIEILKKEKGSLLIIVDEAKGVDEGIFEAVRRCNANKVLYTSSTDPEVAEGEFYDFFNRQSELFRNDDGNYNLFSSTYLDCPHILENKEMVKEIESQIELRGREDPWVKSWAFAEFSEGGSGCIFDLVKVGEAMNEMVTQIEMSDPHIRCGIDLSGGKRDATVLCCVKNNHCWVEKRYFEQDAIKLAHMLFDDLSRLGVRDEHVNVDNGGMGDPIIDYFVSKGRRVNRVDFGGKARNGRRYLNRRAEMYDDLNIRIRKGELCIKYDEKLRNEFNMIKRTSDDTGHKMKIIPKADMPRSPDNLDSLILALVNCPEFPTEEYVAQKRKDRFSPYPSYDELMGAEEEESYFYG